MAELLKEIWEPKAQWLLNETKDKTVDGKSILGIVEGQFFVPDGTSRNRRFYSRELWDKALTAERTTHRLKHATMFGAIGHDDRPVSEEDLRKGDVSHIMTSLWVDESGAGMGRAHILGTESGKNLFIYLKAGALLKTSSRATGAYVEGAQKDGVPIVDPDQFELETFDFVIDPGFLETNPVLKERLEREQREFQRRGGDMDLELLNKQLRESRDLALAEAERLRGELAKAVSERDELKKQASGSHRLGELNFVPEARIAEVSDFIRRVFDTGLMTQFVESVKTISEDDLKFLVGSKISEVRATLAKLEVLGSPEAIERALQGSKAALMAYGKIGTVKDIREAVDASKKALSEYLKIGPVAEVKKALREATQLLKAYSKLGSVKEVAEKMALLATLNKEVETSDRETKAEQLSARYDVPFETVFSLIETHGGDEKKVSGLLEAIKGNRPPIEGARKETKKGIVVDLAESRSSRVFQSMTR